MCSVTNFRRLTSPMSRSRGAAQDFAHGGDQVQGTLVAHRVVHAVCVLSRAEDAFFAQDRQVLGYVALRGPDRLDDVLDAQLVLAQYAQDLQAQGMRDSPHGARHPLDLLPAAYQLEYVLGLAPCALLSNFHERSL